MATEELSAEECAAWLFRGACIRITKDLLAFLREHSDVPTHEAVAIYCLGKIPPQA